MTAQQVEQIRDGLSLDSVKAVCDAIPPGKASGYTQWRHGHVSEFNGQDGYWREVLSPELVKRLTEVIEARE